MKISGGLEIRFVNQQRLIIHLDMDSFYVSVERLLDPSLEGKPVVVGGSAKGRGVVASASYEAREYGVRSAMPMAVALRKCPHLTIVKGTHGRYSEYARQIEEVLLQYTPMVQMASQDEAYMDLSGCDRLWGAPAAAGHRIREHVKSATKLPASVGVGANKLVAKVASALCKPAGMLWVPGGSEEAFFRPLSIGKLPGIGPKTEEKLKVMGVQTLGDLQRWELARLERLFGSHGRDLWFRSRGRSDSPVVSDEAPKSMSHEETFAQDTQDADFLDSIMANLAEKVAYRLRKHECRAATVTLKYRYQGFETHTAAVTLPAPTNDELAILRAARRLLEDHWDRRRPIRLLGIAGGNLRWGSLQMDLLEAPGDPKQAKLHEAIDSVKGKHGYGSLRRGVSGGRHEEKNEKQWG